MCLVMLRKGKADTVSKRKLSRTFGIYHKECNLIKKSRSPFKVENPAASLLLA